MRSHPSDLIGKVPHTTGPDWLLQPCLPAPALRTPRCHPVGTADGLRQVQLQAVIEAEGDLTQGVWDLQDHWKSLGGKSNWTPRNDSQNTPSQLAHKGLLSMLQSANRLPVFDCKTTVLQTPTVPAKWCPPTLPITPMRAGTGHRLQLPLLLKYLITLTQQQECGLKSSAKFTRCTNLQIRKPRGKGVWEMWFSANSHLHAVHSARLFDWGCERRCELSITHVTQHSFPAHRGLVFFFMPLLLLFYLVGMCFISFSIQQTLFHSWGFPHMSPPSSCFLWYFLPAPVREHPLFWNVFCHQLIVSLFFHPMAFLYKQGVDYLFIHFVIQATNLLAIQNQ